MSNAFENHGCGWGKRKLTTCQRMSGETIRLVGACVAHTALMNVFVVHGHKIVNGAND